MPFPVDRNNSPQGYAPLFTDAPSSPLQALFLSLFHNMAEGAALHEVICDGEGRAVNYRILHVNPQYESFTGLKPDQVTGKLATEAYATPTPPYLEEFAAVGLGGPPARMETYFPPLGRYYEISIAPMGKGYFATLFQDVSERTRQEKALRAKTEELDRFFTLTQDLLCIADTGGCFLHLNHAWERTLGWPTEHLVGAHCLDLIFPEDQASVQELLNQMSAGHNQHSYACRCKCKEGSYRWIEWRLTSTGEGLIYAVGRDVTEKCHYQKALQESEEKFRRIYNLIPSPVTLSDLEGVLLSCNDAFCEVTGYTREEVLGRNTCDVGIWIEPEDRKAMINAINENGRLDTFFCQVRCKNGNFLFAQFSARLFEEEGRETLLILARDASDPDALLYGPHH